MVLLARSRSWGMALLCRRESEEDNSTSFGGRPRGPLLESSGAPRPLGSAVLTALSTTGLPAGALVQFLREVNHLPGVVVGVGRHAHEYGKTVVRGGFQLGPVGGAPILRGLAADR